MVAVNSITHPLGMIALGVNALSLLVGLLALPMLTSGPTVAAG